jgi:GH25 family lysozyme M1 (1,4-beta-N-acetylmuramidase)/SH3-like domain-containing protein
MYSVIGPDISFYQDDDATPEGVDFAKMKENAEFVIIRVGQSQWIDSDFRTNWAAAKAVGLPRGSYWFYDSRSDPKRQAELWANALKDDPGELPLCADFEDNYGGPHGGWRKWYTFLENMKNLLPGKEIVIYTASFYWQQNGPDPETEASSLEYFHQYPLWIANYQVSKPNVPAPWGEDEWLWWQYTAHGDGATYGVESKNIDLNYFNGDLDAFRARFDLSTSPTPPVTTTYKVDLSLRESPSKDASVLGNLAQDDEVEKLDTKTDWVKVRRADGLVGWVLADYLVAQEAPPVTPALKPWAKVLPVALNVRASDSSSAEVVGVLRQDQVVRVLEMNDDQSWVKIVDEDFGSGVEGWSDSEFFLFYDEKPGDEPPAPEEKWFKVNVYALNVRQGPSTSDNVVGKVVQDDLVKQLEVDDSQRWYRVIKQDGSLEGWVYAYYLVETEAPEDPGDDPNDPGDDPDIDPTDPYLGRFQVTAYALNLRAGPSTSNPVVGRLTKGEVIFVLEATDDGGWRKVEKGDGTTSWCSARYLVRHPAPIAEKKKYFSGAVRYIREIFTQPRNMIVNILVVDHKTDYKLKYLITPPAHENPAAPMCASTTSEFLKKNAVQFAVNGDGYTHVNPADVPDLSCPEDRDLLKPNSYAASLGNVYSQRWDNRPIMYINKNNEITFNEPKGAIYNAISGDRMLVERGEIPAGLDNSVLQPRTAVGASANGRYLIMIVVDGRQPGYSEGCTLYELAEMLIKYGGVHNAINLDGGGSSAMVIEKNGEPDVVNSPIEGGIAGRERSVANHLGIEVKS